MRAAQPGAHHDRHRHAVGRLVRLQRRQRGRGGRRRRQRLHHHHARGRRRRRHAGRRSSGSSRGKPTVLGFCSGAVARPGRHHAGAGFVTPTGAVIIGVLAGVVPLLRLHQAQERAQLRRRARHLRRARRRRHARRARSPASSPRPRSTPNLNTNLKDIVGKTLWLEQLKAMGLTLVVSVVGTVVLASIVKALIGLRPTPKTKKRASTTPTTARPATTTRPAAATWTTPMSRVATRPRRGAPRRPPAAAERLIDDLPQGRAHVKGRGNRRGPSLLRSCRARLAGSPAFVTLRALSVRSGARYMSSVIVVVAEKPSVARDIARVLGARERGDGCPARATATS